MSTLALVLVLVLVPGGCDDPTGSTRLARAGETESPLAVATSVTDGGAHPGHGSPEPDPIMLYPDLMVFPWYRRGEPLVFNGRDFLPDGKPLAIRADELRRAGSYQGVAFYVRRADQPPFSVVYVPVFDGFWEPFLAQQPEPRPAEE